MIGGLDQLVQQRVSAFNENPQALAERYGRDQNLLDLLALQKLKAEKDAVARQLQMQMQTQPNTIREQKEAEMMGRTKQEIAQQTAQLSQQEEAQKQQMLERLASGGVGSLPMNQQYAGGGIVSFADGGNVLRKYARATGQSVKEGLYDPIAELLSAITSGTAGVVGDLGGGLYEGFSGDVPEEEKLPTFAELERIRAEDKAAAVSKQLGGPTRDKANQPKPDIDLIAEASGGAGGSAPSSSAQSAPSARALSPMEEELRAAVSRNVAPKRRDAEESRARAAAGEAFDVTDEERALMQRRADEYRKYMEDRQRSPRDQAWDDFLAFAQGTSMGARPGKGGLGRALMGGALSSRAAQDARIQQRGEMEAERFGIDSLLPEAERGARGQRFTAGEKAREGAAGDERAAMQGGVSMLNIESQREAAEATMALRQSIQEAKAAAGTDPVKMLAEMRMATTAYRELRSSIEESYRESLSVLRARYPKKEDYDREKALLDRSMQAQMSEVNELGNSIKLLSRQTGTAKQGIDLAALMEQFGFADPFGFTVLDQQ
jgi:hypothetical protein